MNFDKPPELQRIFFRQSLPRSRTPVKKTNGGMFFKAYVEDAQESTILSELPLQAAPVVFGTDSILTKVSKKFSLSFTVMPDNRKEAIDNYAQLKKLIDWLKPTYMIERAQYIPVDRNVYGTLNIMFMGLPILSTFRQIITTSFSYDINKDLGFISAPDSTTIFKGNNKLIPISFKISMEAKVNLSSDSVLDINAVGISTDN